jgi:hypothetical protein
MLPRNWYQNGKPLRCSSISNRRCPCSTRKTVEHGIFMDFLQFFVAGVGVSSQDGKFDAGDINVGYTKVLKVGFAAS